MTARTESIGRPPESSPPDVLSAAQTTPPAGHRRKKKLTLQWALIIGAVALPFLILGLAFVPVPQSYSFTIVTLPAPPYYQARALGWAGFPAMVPGSHVSGSWTSEDGVPVEFNITDGGTVIFSANGSSGSFSFTAKTWYPGVFVYTSQVGLNISVSGSYWSPEWPILGLGTPWL